MAEDATYALAELRDIHLPPLSRWEQIGDALIAFGLGLTAVLLLLAIISALVRLRTNPEPTIAYAGGTTALIELTRSAARNGYVIPSPLREELFQPGAETKIAALKVRFDSAGEGR